MQLGRTTAAMVVGIAVLAGRSDGGTANETLPPVSSPAAPTSEALQPLGPPDLPMPAEARKQDADGAKAFLSYYIELMNYSTAKLDTQPLRALSGECQTCAKFADGLDDVAASQQRIEGAQFALNGSSDPLLQGNSAEFALSLTQRESRLISATTGEPLPGFDQDEFLLAGSGALLTWLPSTASWVMTDLTFQ